MTNTLNTPVEALEIAFPFRVERYGLRRGSGGAGRHRGGDGIVREYLLLAPAIVTMQSERRSSRALGSGRRRPRRVRAQLLIHPDGSEEELPAKFTRRLAAGDRLRVETPGGGGWGARRPHRRGPAYLSGFGPCTILVSAKKAVLAAAGECRQGAAAGWRDRTMSGTTMRDDSICMEKQAPQANPQPRAAGAAAPRQAQRWITRFLAPKPPRTALSYWKKSGTRCSSAAALTTSFPPTNGRPPGGKIWAKATSGSSPSAAADTDALVGIAPLYLITL